MKINENVDVICYKNKVVLANKKNGYWLRITKEVYDYLKYAIQLGYSKDKFLEAFTNLDDKQYMEAVCLKMERLGITEENRVVFFKEISIELTNRCNLQCLHCCIDANSSDCELNTSEWEETFNKIVLWKPERIVLSGGEPLIRNDIIELIVFLRSIYTGEITLCTNSLLINEHNVDVLIKNIDQIDISIDGIDEETCSSIRGKGVFEKVIRKIRFLQEKRFNKISLSMAVSDKNESLIEKFYLLNQKLNTHPVIRDLTFIGRGKREKKYLTDLPDNEIAMKKLDISDSEKKVVFYGNCLYNHNKIFLRSDGTIYSCPLVLDEKCEEGSIQNIHDLHKIGNEKMLLLKRILLNNNENCQNCAVVSFCWSCLAKIKVYSDNCEMEDYCNKVKEFLFNVIWGE